VLSYPITTYRKRCRHDTLSRDQQVQAIGALTEGLSIRAIERMTGIHRDTIMRLGGRVGQGCAELHDRTMVGLRVGRLELDELWAFVGKKQRHLRRGDSPEKGDQYTFVALASTSRAIVAYRTGKRDTGTTQELSQTCGSAYLTRRKSQRVASCRISRRSRPILATAIMA
jgi:hypothetical protein